MKYLIEVCIICIILAITAFIVVSLFCFIVDSVRDLIHEIREGRHDR